MLEVLITMLIVGMVTASIMAIFISLQRSERFSADRTDALDAMRLAMQRMTKEIRQATVISDASDASRIEMDTYILGETKHVVYAVSGDRLTRQLEGGTAVVVGEDLDVPYPADEDFFTYTIPEGGTVADSRVVSILLRVHPPRRPDTTLELKSEVRLRNRTRA